MSLGVLSSKNGISSYLSFSEHDCINALNSRSDIKGVDLEDAVRTFHFVRRLRSHINEFFLVDERGQVEPSMLYHDDLSMHNILVDDNGNLTGVVDWNVSQHCRCGKYATILLLTRST